MKRGRILSAVLCTAMLLSLCVTGAAAVEQKVTSGTGNNQFSPARTCTRGQIVSFLYRTFAG